MTYYKIMINNQFIGIGTTYDLRKYQLKHHIIITSNEDDAQFIQHNEELYRDVWFAALTTELDFKRADIYVITKEEYDAIYQAIESGDEIIIDEDDTPQEEEPDIDIDPNEESTIEFVRNSKINEMSNACNQTITNGFYVTLSDDEEYHFSLTIQDQLNLITLSNLIANGETQIPYHADGELCRYYSAQDIMTIVDEATKFKTYHVTYFNSLREYIYALEDIAAISNITYGCLIPEEYQSDILKDLINGLIGDLYEWSE